MGTPHLRAVASAQVEDRPRAISALADANVWTIQKTGFSAPAPSRPPATGLKIGEVLRGHLPAGQTISLTQPPPCPASSTI